MLDELQHQDTPRNESVPTHRMFACGPEEIRTEWLDGSARWRKGIERIGGLLNGGRA